MATDTRERILASSGPVFAARGFAGATTRALASAAGVNIATLAWHFGDKQGLYDAVIVQHFEAILALELPKSWPADREARIREAIHLLWDFIEENRVVARLILRHVLDARALPEPARGPVAARLRKRGLELLAALDLESTRDWRLELLSMNHLLVRYAVSDDADLVAWAGQDDPRAAVRAHLEHVAVRLLV